MKALTSIIVTLHFLGDAAFDIYFKNSVSFPSLLALFFVTSNELVGFSLQKVQDHYLKLAPNKSNLSGNAFLSQDHFIFCIFLLLNIVEQYLLLQLLVVRVQLCLANTL